MLVENILSIITMSYYFSSSWIIAVIAFLFNFFKAIKLCQTLLFQISVQIPSNCFTYPRMLSYQEVVMPTGNQAERCIWLTAPFFFSPAPSLWKQSGTTWFAQTPFLYFGLVLCKCRDGIINIQSALHFWVPGEKKFNFLLSSFFVCFYKRVILSTKYASIIYLFIIFIAWTAQPQKQYSNKSGSMPRRSLWDPSSDSRIYSLWSIEHRRAPASQQPELGR